MMVDEDIIDGRNKMSTIIKKKKVRVLLIKNNITTL